MPAGSQPARRNHRGHSVRSVEGSDSEVIRAPKRERRFVLFRSDGSVRYVRYQTQLIYRSERRDTNRPFIQ